MDWQEVRRSAEFFPHHECLITPRDVAIFSLSFLFFGNAKNLGTCEATKDRSSASFKNREKKKHLEEPSDWDSLRTAL